MSILPELKERFRGALAGLVDEPAELLELIRRSQDPKFGDYQANFAMPLGKRLRRPPREVAAEVVGRLDLADLCQPPEIAGPGFINLRLKDDWLVERLTAAVADPRLGIAPAARPRTFVDRLLGPQRGQADARRPHPLDGDRRRPVPRAAVPRPPGHQRQPHRRLGHAVRHDPLRLQALPRRGGLSAEPGRGAGPAVSAGPPADGLSGGGKNVGGDGRRCRRRRAAFGRASDIDAAVLAETAKLHAGDAENRRLWQEFLPFCVDEIERIYRRLGVRFDHTLGESFYEDRLAPMVDELLARGIARDSDGAVCIFLEGQKVPMIVRKQDGAFLYATTDLATIRYRMETWRPDAILYVVDHRQSLHFQQLFAAARLLGYEDVELQHVSFGTVLGDDGRPFKTRSGDTVGLEGLLDEAVRRAAEIVAANDDAKPDGPELSPPSSAADRRDGGHRRLEIRRPLAEPHQRLRLQLRQDAGHERQHGHVHAVRLRPGAEHLCQGQRGRRRRCARPARRFVLGSPAERALGLELLRFSEALDLAVADYRPNQLTAYLFDLANRYSTFFEQCPRAAGRDATSCAKAGCCSAT